MRYCPQCRSEFQADRTFCSDCDVPLVDELPAVVAPKAWVEVFRGEAVRADVVSSALEAAGIETLTPDEFTSNLGFYAPAPVIRVLVPDADVADAREIVGGLHRIEEPAPEQPAPAASEPPAPGAVRLMLRSCGDLLIALAAPMVIAAPVSGRLSGGQGFLIYLLVEPAFLGVALWRRRRIRTSAGPILPLRSNSSETDVVTGVAIGLCMVGLAWLYTKVVLRDSAPSSPAPFQAWEGLSAIVAIGVAPICEEFFFRGAVLGAFVAAGRNSLGLLYSTTLFTAIHFAPMMAPLHFAVGWILALTSLKTRSLLAPIVAHAAYNLAVLATGLTGGS